MDFNYDFFNRNYLDDEQWVKCKLFNGAECQHDYCKKDFIKNKPAFMQNIETKITEQPKPSSFDQQLRTSGKF